MLKNDCHIFASLYITSQIRSSDLDSCFAQENHSYPMSISEYEKLRKRRQKSDFWECLLPFAEPLYTSPVTDALVLDGEVFVHMNLPDPDMFTFGDYCKKQLSVKIQQLANIVSRVDAVFDVYREFSIK